MEVEVSIGGPEKLEGTLVLVDVYKSSTAITVALDNGANFVLPFESEEEARDARENWTDEEVTLAGEKIGMKIEGFDMNISPREMSEENVENKVLIYKSDNLTRIIEKCKNAGEVLIGGLINSRAVGEYLNEAEPGRVEIIACGTYNKDSIGELLEIPCDPHNEVSIEDLIGAGSICSYLDGDYFSDLALLATLAYENRDWEEKVREGCVIRALRQVGYEEDIPLCLTENQIDTIPTLNGDRIVKMTEKRPSKEVKN